MILHKSRAWERIRESRRHNLYLMNHLAAANRKLNSLEQKKPIRC